MVLMLNALNAFFEFIQLKIQMTHILTMSYNIIA